jgi:integrase
LLREGNQVREGGLSPRSVQYIHTILHRAFKDAVRWGRITVSPADSADPPRLSASRKKEVTVWPASTVRHFFERAAEEGDLNLPLWTLLATTGMRRGEALGLRWSDRGLDRVDGQASIRQTVICVNHEVQFGSPKTAKGRRAVALDSGTVKALRSHRTLQVELRLQIGENWQDHDLVFCQVDGGPLNPEHISAMFTRRGKRWGLPKLTLHGLRHTWATLALQSNVHPRVVQERLGHSTVGVTLDTYSHVTVGMQQQAADDVASLLL